MAKNKAQIATETPVETVIDTPNMADKESSISSLEANKYPQRWKKGQTGNPNGRPKDTFSLTVQIKRKLKDKIDITIGKKRYRNQPAAEVLAERIVDKAIRHVNPALVKEILNRVDGSVREDKAPASTPISYIQIVHSNGIDNISVGGAASSEGQAENKCNTRIYKDVSENISEKNDKVKLLPSGVEAK